MYVCPVKSFECTEVERKIIILPRLRQREREREREREKVIFLICILVVCMYVPCTLISHAQTILKAAIQSWHSIAGAPKSIV